MTARGRWDDPAAMASVLAALQRDAVVVLPTDTLYGFSGRARSPKALAKIAALKGIASPRGFVALVDSVAAIRRDAAPAVDRRVFELLERAGPAPLTVVVAVQTPQLWGEPGPPPTAAYRVPAHAALRGLIARLGEPLVSTSVNRTGEAPLASAEAILAAFGVGIDGCIADPDCEARSPVASTLADCTAWPPRVLRPGAYDLAAAMAALESGEPGGR